MTYKPYRDPCLAGGVFFMEKIGATSQRVKAYVTYRTDAWHSAADAEQLRKRYLDDNRCMSEAETHQQATQGVLIQP